MERVFFFFKVDVIEQARTGSMRAGASSIITPDVSIISPEVKVQVPPPTPSASGAGDQESAAMQVKKNQQACCRRCGLGVLVGM